MRQAMHPTVLSSRTAAVPALLTVSLVCACTDGPDYRPPRLPLPERWNSDVTAADAASRGSRSDESPGRCWTVVNDPTLDQLMQRALAENRTEARVRRNISTAGFAPARDNPLNTDRQQIAGADALAVSDGELSSNLIRLYAACGGGWGVLPITPAARANAN